MTGKWSEVKEKHSHLIIKTSDKDKLYFTDTRRFGNIKLLNEEVFLKKYAKERDLLNYNTSIKKNVEYLLKNIKTNHFFIPHFGYIVLQVLCIFPCIFKLRFGEPSEPLFKGC